MEYWKVEDSELINNNTSNDTTLKLTDTISINFDIFGLIKGAPKIHFDEATEERNFEVLANALDTISAQIIAFAAYIRKNKAEIQQNLEDPNVHTVSYHIKGHQPIGEDTITWSTEKIEESEDKNV